MREAIKGYLMREAIKGGNEGGNQGDNQGGIREALKEVHEFPVRLSPR